MGETPERSETEEELRARLLVRIHKNPEAAHFALLLAKESDRGAVLVATGFADALLEDLLRSACVTADCADDLIGSFSSPLGSFGARILSSYALGLLPENEYWNLEQLRKTRNYCAHHIGEVTFDDPKVKDHMNNLRVPDWVGTSALYRLAFVVGCLQSWIAVSKPELLRRDRRRLLVLAATRKSS